jgi:hypothetical protein
MGLPLLIRHGRNPNRHNAATQANRNPHALRLQAKQGKLVECGRHKNARIWELPPQKTLV